MEEKTKEDQEKMLKLSFQVDEEIKKKLEMQENLYILKDYQSALNLKFVNETKKCEILQNQLKQGDGEKSPEEYFELKQVYETRILELKETIGQGLTREELLGKQVSALHQKVEGHQQRQASYQDEIKQISVKFIELQNQHQQQKELIKVYGQNSTKAEDKNEELSKQVS